MRATCAVALALTLAPVAQSSGAAAAARAAAVETAGALAGRVRTAPPGRARKPVPKSPRRTPPRLACGDYLAFQVLLDRAGFSPGEIDGKPGDNFTHAIVALQQSRQLPLTTQPDCDTWRALGGDQMQPAITSYRVTDQDMKGPFVKTIPGDLMAQAKLPSLEYRSPLEMLAERFHASPALLERLNRGARLAAGREIQVPAVTPFDAKAKPALDHGRGDRQRGAATATAAADEGALTIQVSREESALRAIRADGSLAFFAPVTTGSEHDPLPPGTWKVTGVLWRPVFHYNPKLFWDAKADDARATIKAGANNPVGVVWISLDLEHYGLHGTPEPGRIGHVESHGCVRLTNWDAARVASLVTRGTPVIFK
ncbi:MAG TPA: L,D-transpeptidase family protein [Vicinamibacterales bacterium]|nr:L,D-transpeptidase family protein [Vicinamibacterales bacterium]